MRKALLFSFLALVLAACGGQPYTATGLWQGYATNSSSPGDSVLVRFSLLDQNGALSGSHFAFINGTWTYIGSVQGNRSGQDASWRVDGANGYIQINGRFDGDRFTGSYFLVAYGSGSLSANLSLSRQSTQPSPSSLLTPEDTQTLSGSPLDVFHEFAKLGQ